MIILNDKDDGQAPQGGHIHGLKHLALRANGRRGKSSLRGENNRNYTSRKE